MRNLILILAFSLLPEIPVMAQNPGDTPSHETNNKLKDSYKHLEIEINKKNLPAINARVEEIRVLLGPYAGIPESPEHNILPVDTNKPDTEKLLTIWQTTFENTLKKEGVNSSLAVENKLELREFAYIALSCFAASSFDENRAAQYHARARQELDYLLERQAENGLFPYPANPGGNAPPNVRKLAEQAARANPNSVRNDYLYLDIPDMQFDVACSTVAMCEGYRIVNDNKYRESAQKGGDWALSMPMSANWNYNAFSVWLLANVYNITGDTKYLEGALEKTNIGVLPGLMTNGRWVDQHNAKQSYHFIMIRALSDLVAFMPKDHPNHEIILKKLILATDSRVNDILRDGVSNTDSAIWGLSKVITQQGTTTQRTMAAQAIINAMLHTGAKGMKSSMFPYYLLTLKCHMAATNENNPHD